MGVVMRHAPELTNIIFELYRSGRVRDTKIREELYDIRNNKLHTKKKRGLKDLAARYLGVQMVKGEDSWQLRYGELIDVPISQWPHDAVQYALNDARYTLEVFNAQTIEMPDEGLQCRAAFSLFLMSGYGIITDPVLVKELGDELNSEHDHLKKFLMEKAFLRSEGVKKGAKDTAYIQHYVNELYDGKAPLTKGGEKGENKKVQINQDSLTPISYDPTIEKYLLYSQISTLRNTFLPTVEAGTRHRINHGYNTLVRTGRTSSYKPNSQNFPRGTDDFPIAKKVRRCFIPRPGFLYASCDYAAAELRAVAQLCFTLFGRSALRDDFIAGKDPHMELAKEMGIDRGNLVKAANFGFWGGLGPPAFVEYARNMYGLHLTIQQAHQTKLRWMKKNPEQVAYFKVTKYAYQQGSTTQFKSKRVRGGITYTSSANTLFQGLVADAIKDAMFVVTDACYSSPTHILYGARPVFMLHDELILEVKEDVAHEQAKELQRIMMSVASEWMPDVPQTGDVCLMRRWFKEAEPVYDQEERLIPWSP